MVSPRKLSAFFCAFVLIVGCSEDRNAPPPEVGPFCVAGTTGCRSGVVRTCAADGSQFVDGQNCAAEGLSCHPTLGCIETEAPVACVEGAVTCDATGNPSRCEDGEIVVAEACAEGSACLETVGCSPCVADARQCLGADVFECDVDAMRFALADSCDPRIQACSEGTCASRCADGDGGEASHEGCRFWAVDLDNVRDVREEPIGDRSPEAALRIAVASLAEREPTEVEVRLSADLEASPEHRVVIQPRGAAVIELSASGLGAAAPPVVVWRISSDHPVSVVQLESSESGFAATLDGSLLLPQRSLAQEYVVTSPAGLVGERSSTTEEPRGAFIVAVGTTQDPVGVRVVPTRPVSAGPNARLTVDEETGAVTRVDGQVAEFSALVVLSEVGRERAPGDADLSGSTVGSGGPILVFVGSLGALNADPDVEDRCCGDHVEWVLRPEAHWGTRFVMVPTEDRFDVWRMTAGESGAVLTYLPDRPPSAPTNLAPNATAYFHHQSDLLVESNRPIRVVQALTTAEPSGPDPRRADCEPNPGTGTDDCTILSGYAATCLADGCAPLVERAALDLPPLSRFASRVAFVVPAIDASDYLVVAAPYEAAVYVDDEALTGFHAIESGLDGRQWGRYVVELSDGWHEIEATEPVGAWIYGNRPHQSYAWALQ